MAEFGEATLVVLGGFFLPSILSWGVVVTLGGLGDGDPLYSEH